MNNNYKFALCTIGEFGDLEYLYSPTETYYRVSQHGKFKYNLPLLFDTLEEAIEFRNNPDMFKVRELFKDRDIEFEKSCILSYFVKLVEEKELKLYNNEL